MKKITQKPWIKHTIKPNHSEKELSENEIKYTNFRLYLNILFGLIIFSIFTILAISRSFDDVVEYDPEGKPRLKTERRGKLRKDLARIDSCDQYSLRATVTGWYPCYSCVDTTAIFLHIGEVWKYGEKCGYDPRYTRIKLNAMNLDYVPEFKGDKTACYKEQQRKIYNYPLLPENLKRVKKLGHPPGNKQDS